MHRDPPDILRLCPASRTFGFIAFPPFGRFPPSGLPPRRRPLRIRIDDQILHGQSDGAQDGISRTSRMAVQEYPALSVLPGLDVDAQAGGLVVMAWAFRGPVTAAPVHPVELPQNNTDIHLSSLPSIVAPPVLSISSVRNSAIFHPAVHNPSVGKIMRSPISYSSNPARLITPNTNNPKVPHAK